MSGDYVHVDKWVLYGDAFSLHIGPHAQNYRLELGADRFG